MLPVSRKFNQNWIPELFNDFFTDDWVDRTGNSTPAINVIENEHGFELELAAPGMTKEDFKVSLDEDRNMVVELDKKVEKTDENKDCGHYLRREFSYTKFQQTLLLPDDVNREAINATVEHGVLKVVLPKLQPQEMKKERTMIEIQ